MAELINQILALPRSEKWQILAILTEVLREEEEGKNSKIPQWQIETATKARTEIEKGKVKSIPQDQFWAAIDSKIEELEKRTGT